jgi:ABC-2 type transport system permease protein
MTLQNLLGRNYKWIFFVKFYLKTHIAYLGDTLVRSFGELFALTSTILVWFITTNGSHNFDTKEIITYLVVGFFYTAFTFTWYTEDLGMEIRNGYISASLLRPTSKFWVSICEYIGRGVLGEFLTTLVPLLLILPFVANLITWPSLPNLMFTFAFLPISYFIKHTLEMAFGCIAFWLTQIGGILRFKSQLEVILEGSKIPLNILAIYLPFVLYLPYAFLIHYPVQIWLGKFNFGEVVQIYTYGLLWCLATFLISRWIFKLGLKKNEAVGL